MSKAARTFWSIYYANMLRRENMISQEEYVALTRNRDNFPLYNNHVTEYNRCRTPNDLTGGAT